MIWSIILICNGAKFPISNFSVIQTDFNSFLPVCNGMAARHPCMARVAQGIFARNCQLANAGSRLAGKSRSLRLQTGAAPYACLGGGCRAQLASRAYDSSFFFFFFAARAREFQEHAPLREWADYDTVNQNLKIPLENTCFAFNLVCLFVQR